MMEILSTEKLMAFIATLRVHPFIKTPDKPSSPQEGGPVEERLGASVGVSIGGGATESPGTGLLVEPLTSRVPEHGQPREKAAAGEPGAGALEGVSDGSSRRLESSPPAGCAEEPRGVVSEGARRPRRGERRRAGGNVLAEQRGEAEEVWDPVGISRGAGRAPPDIQTEMRHPKPQLPSPRYRCVECGTGFREETALHGHYIQHARGELG